MQKLALFGLFVMLALVSGCLQQQEQAPTLTEGEEPEAVATVISQFIRTPHFVNSVPAHGEVWATVPDEVLLNFNFDVRPPSYIKITKDGTDVTEGETSISEDSLSMRVPMKKSLGDGEYIVNYHACWPDRSCHDGGFGFIVDSALKTQMTDLTGQASVTVNMESLMFSPRYIRISPGTKVTFVNKENVEHFVNTDPHPSHNYLLTLNSRGFTQGQSYEYTFTEAGEVHYHCSAHENQGMDAIILVE